MNGFARILLAGAVLIASPVAAVQPNAWDELTSAAIRFEEQGRYAEAESLARTPHNLGLCYAAQRRYQEAELTYRRSLKIAEQSFGPTHPDMAIILADYALFCGSCGKRMKPGAWRNKLASCMCGWIATIHRSSK
jgi:tetratricopeptide (TPR) repeat protein